MTDNQIFITDLGYIGISKNAIGKLILDCLSKFTGKVFLSNQKGKIYRPSSKKNSFDYTSNMDIQIKQDRIDIRVFVVLKFGTSIAQVTNTLINDIHENLKRVLGKDPDSVAVVVSGTISKKIAKRSIEVKKRYDGKEN